MSQSFDDLANNYGKTKENKARLEEEKGAEWSILLGFISQFALDNKGLDEQKFVFTKSLSDQPMLVLNSVAAVLESGGNAGGVPQKFRVRFGQKPAHSPGQVFVDDSPLPADTWTLTPEIQNDEIVWLVSERDERYSSSALAVEVAKNLARYHIAYEKAFDREA